MMNAGHKRLKLLLLTLAILACGVMVLGGTFATQVTLTGDKTTLPPETRFDVTVLYHDGTNYKLSMLDDAAVFTQNVPWCPGYTKLVYFAVQNHEAFPVQCMMKLNAGTSNLSDVLEYAVLTDVTPNSDNRPTKWADITTEKQLQKGLNPVFDSLVLGSKNVKYYALAVHMKENAGNQYQKQSMSLEFQFTVNANYAPGETPAP